MDLRPIGMFDSGCGGLTVLNEYVNLMPNENFIYFGDVARLPYGAKSKETIIEYSKQIINFLISKNVKMIVIACGTASAQAYDTVKDLYDIQIRDIINPTAQKIAGENVGVIATKGTISSNSWENAIHKYHPTTKVSSVACPLFVPIVEEGLCNSEIANLACEMYLKELKGKNITSLILGCTHYSILKETITNTIGENVNIINTGLYSALDSKEFLMKNNLENDAKNIGNVICYSSDNASTFKDYSRYFPKLNLENVEKINIAEY